MVCYACAVIVIPDKTFFTHARLFPGSCSPHVTSQEMTFELKGQLSNSRKEVGNAAWDKNALDKMAAHSWLKLESYEKKV